MKALLIKDLIGIKTQLKTYLFVIIIWGITFAFNSKIDVFWGLMSVITAMIIQTNMALDERSKWDKFGLTMPVSRRKIVYSKYLLSVILSVITSLICLIVAVIVNKGFNLESLEFLMLSFSVSIIIVSLDLPLIFKFGYDKSKYILMAIVGVPIAIIVIIAQLNPIDENTVITDINFTNYFPILAIIIFVCSIYLSLKFYNKKEF